MKRIFFLIILSNLLTVIGCSSTHLVIKDGIHREYYDDGVIKSIHSYQNNKLDGVQRDYRKTGTLQSATIYQDGSVISRNTYYADGSLWRKEFYRFGRLTQRTTFDQNGYIILKEDFQ